jgi:hypothetical protein
VGWIYFRKGDCDRALPYIRAAWLLMQDPAVGNHLGQLYEKLGKKSEAAHQYELALATTSSPNADQKKEIRQRYKTLTGKEIPENFQPVLHRHRSGEFFSPGDELSHMRTTRISSAPHEAGSADFTIIFAHGKSAEAKYVSGKESLKLLAQKVSRTKLETEIPDNNPVRVFRRGILMCGQTGCDFVFFLPDQTSTRPQ